MTTLKKEKQSQQSIKNHCYTIWTMKAGKKRQQEVKKSAISSRNASANTCLWQRAKLNELQYELLHQPLYSPKFYLGPKNCYMLYNFKSWLFKKGNASNAKLMHFLSSWQIIHMLEKHRNKCIHLEGNYVVKQLDFWQWKLFTWYPLNVLLHMT